MPFISHKTLSQIRTWQCASRQSDELLAAAYTARLLLHTQESDTLCPAETSSTCQPARPDSNLIARVLGHSSLMQQNLHCHKSSHTDAGYWDVEGETEFPPLCAVDALHWSHAADS